MIRTSMSLPPGHRLEVCEVQSLLGADGMGRCIALATAVAIGTSRSRSCQRLSPLIRNEWGGSSRRRGLPQRSTIRTSSRFMISERTRARRFSSQNCSRACPSATLSARARCRHARRSFVYLERQADDKPYSVSWCADAADRSARCVHGATGLTRRLTDRVHGSRKQRRRSVGPRPASRHTNAIDVHEELLRRDPTADSVT
jgi:hypothetical protein